MLCYENMQVVLHFGSIVLNRIFLPTLTTFLELQTSWTANWLKPPPPPPPPLQVILLLAVPKAALLFWFFGGFRCGVPLYSYRYSYIY